MSPKEGTPISASPLIVQIRCDATSEANVEQCSSCKRAGVNCSFSRVPMKRGPTKGLEAQYHPLVVRGSLTLRYIRELEDRLVSLEYSVTKGQVHGREHSAPPRHRAEYSSGGNTPPQLIYSKPHQHQNEPVKLNPVLSSHSRNTVDRLPPIEAIHGSPPVNNEKRHSTDFLRPFHPPRHEPMMQHNSFHQNQHDHHHANSDRRESIDQSQRKMSFPSHPVVHERSSSFNDAIVRRPSLFDK